MHYESPRQSGRSHTATTNSGRTYVAVASPSREDDTRPAGHIKKPSTIRGEAQSGNTAQVVRAEAFFRYGATDEPVKCYWDMK